MKKFLYVSSIITFIIFFYLVGTYIFYLCNRSFDLQDPHHTYSTLFFIYYCIGAIIYFVYYVIHFSFPLNYNNKYLKIVFLIDYIGVIIHFIICILFCTLTGMKVDFLILAFPFMCALFIFMSIMGFIKFIHKKKELEGSDK